MESPFVLESEVQFPGPSVATPVQVYRHKATSMRIVFVDIKGPQATATIVVPTVTQDSRGLPHTLEHLVFCGSRNYPNRGYLDSLANRCLSTGTNAYTTEDYTAYTIATAGRDGMAEILPVFMDHVLHPTLRDDQFVTEVYHVDGEGNQQGVVFSEMAARENSEADLLDLGLRRLLYPTTQTYYYECGGLTSEIPKLTNEDIMAYHKKFYHPSNTTVVVTGDSLEPERIFNEIMAQGILDGMEFEQGVDLIAEMDISQGRGDAPIMSKEAQLTSRTIRFPSAEEDVGSIGYGWLGPGTHDVKTMIALDILFRFLHETSASPFAQAFTERRNPLASHVDFEVKGCIDTSLVLLFSGIPVRASTLTNKARDGDRNEVGRDGDEPVDDDSREDEEEDQEAGERVVDGDDEEEDDDEEDGDEDEEDDDDDDDTGSNADTDETEEKQDLFEAGYFHGLVIKVFQDFVASGLQEDPSEMSRVIARHRTKINESIEDDPHESATSYLVPDILAYAYLEKDKTKPAAIGTRANIFAIIDELETCSPEFWRNLAREWLLEPSMVEVCMIPDSQLGKIIKATVALKHEELVTSLGSEGLEQQKSLVADAVAANKVNITSEIISKMPPIPDVANVPTIPLNARYESIQGNGVDDDQLPSRPFELVQVVETNTFFTHIKLCLPLTHLDEDLRPYLVLFQELLFQSSCNIPKYNDDNGASDNQQERSIRYEHLDYQSLVTEVANTLVSHEAAVGFGNDIFACSWLSELFVLACSAEKSKYREQCELLVRVLMFSEFTEDRVLTVAKNLVTQTLELKRDGVDMLSAIGTRMTSPVRDYEVVTKYCRQADKMARQQHRSSDYSHPTDDEKKQGDDTLVSQTPVLGNDLAISIFRQELFLKRVVQELKAKSDQVPKILARLERIKQALLQSISDVAMNSKRNGNTPAVGFVQIGLPIGFAESLGSSSDGTATQSKVEDGPIQVLCKVWDHEYELYQAMVRSTSASLPRMPSHELDQSSLLSRKRKPSEPFHDQQEQPVLRLARDMAQKMEVDHHGHAEMNGSSPRSQPSPTHPFPFPRTPYQPLAKTVHHGSEAPNSVLIPLKSITSSYLISIIPCDVVFDPRLHATSPAAAEAASREQVATMLLCEILSRNEGPLYSAIRGNGYAYDASLSVYLWTGQMAFEIRDASDPIKAYDAFLDIIRRMETDWEGAVGGLFEMETARASRAYQVCMERSTAGGVLSWMLRGAIRGHEKVEDLVASNNYLDKVTVDDLKHVYRKFLRKFLHGEEGLVTVLLTPPSPPESTKTHFSQYGIDFQEISLTDFEIEPLYDFQQSGTGSSIPATAVTSPATTAPSSTVSSATTTTPSSPVRH
ncbi:hypothetical protein DFQ27_009203 [Actinomortierella ambigua]|uniref:Uncharacterized protein n=1 Tax=Actinomortierella ambigua TaxID=1343610 RepID=A0A9P6QH56_9FUNG|nr:hypothetical protein DFQ27_009203 [Actinomortierella ambigua]